jgi:hypothetical protein
MRKIWRNKTLQERRKFSRMEAWLWIISREAWGVDDPKRGLKRGEFCASRRQLGKVWGWSRSAVQRFLNDLQKGEDPMIKSLGQQTGHQTEQFKICKYETYNPRRDAKRDSKRDILKKDKKKVEIKDSHQSKIDGRVLFDIWLEENKNLPQPRSFGSDRLRKCKARIEEAKRAEMLDQYLKDFREAVSKAQSLPFLCGGGERGWKATFDWFISNHRNVYRVLEGNYDGISTPAPTASDLVGATADPHRTPADWTEMDWTIFRRVNGPEATERLQKRFNYQPITESEANNEV